MVQVGEMTGMLDVTFLRLYEHLEFEKDMKDRIKAAVVTRCFGGNSDGYRYCHR